MEGDRVDDWLDHSRIVRQYEYPRVHTFRSIRMCRLRVKSNLPSIQIYTGRALAKVGFFPSPKFGAAGEEFDKLAALDASHPHT